MKALLNWHYYVLFSLAAVALVGLFSAPADDATAAQLAIGLIASKAIGFASAYLWYRLYAKWRVSGAIPELVNIVNEED